MVYKWLKSMHVIMFEILHKLNPFHPVRDPETSNSMLILLSMFLKCPLNYYNIYNQSQSMTSHLVRADSQSLTIETYRELRPRWKQAEKSDHFLGKIEGESSFPVVYLPCYHGR